MAGGLKIGAASAEIAIRVATDPLDNIASAAEFVHKPSVWTAIGMLPFVCGGLKHADGMVVAEKHVAGALLPEFSRSTIDAVAASSARGRSAQITEGARAIAKKQGHAASAGIKSAFAGVQATQASAETIIRDVLQNPAARVIGDRTIDVYNSAGQGVRFDKATGGFVGFLEGALRTR